MPNKQKQQTKKKNSFSSKQKKGGPTTSRTKTSQSRPKPFMSMFRDTPTTVIQREYLRALGSKTGMPITNPFIYHFNPGDANTFSWLSRLAQNYEFYRLKKAHVHYEPQCPITTVGALYAYFDYDSEDSPCTTVQTVMNNECSDTSAVFKTLDLHIRPDRVHATSPWKKVRVLESTGLTDTSLYEMGKLYLSTSATNEELGVFWVDYEFEFKSPQVPMGSAEATSLEIVSEILLGSTTVQTYIAGPEAGVEDATFKGGIELEAQVPYTLNTSYPGWYRRFKTGRSQHSLLTTTIVFTDADCANDDSSTFDPLAEDWCVAPTVVSSGTKRANLISKSSEHNNGLWTEVCQWEIDLNQDQGDEGISFIRSSNWGKAGVWAIDIAILLAKYFVNSTNRPVVPATLFSQRRIKSLSDRFQSKLAVSGSSQSHNPENHISDDQPMYIRTGEKGWKLAEHGS